MTKSECVSHNPLAKCLLSLTNNSWPAHSVISLPSPPNLKTRPGLGFRSLCLQLLSLRPFHRPALSVQWVRPGLATEWPPYTSALSEMSSTSSPDYRARCTRCTLPATLMRLQPVIHEYEGGGELKENERFLFFYFAARLNEHARRLTETASFTKPAFEFEALKVFCGLYFTVISTR